MKVAVLLTGHIRSHQEVFSNLRTYLLDRYDCDIYCSTWGGDKERRFLSDLYANQIKDLLVQDAHTYNANKRIYLRGLSSGIKNLKNNIELANGIWRVNRLADQYYLVEKGFDLIKDKYDVVVKARFDINFRESIDFSSGCSLTIPYSKRYRVTDHFAFGGMDEMKKYCGIHSSMETLYEDLDIDISYAEPMLYEYLLRYCELPVLVKKFNYTIKRDNGDGFKFFNISKDLERVKLK